MRKKKRSKHILLILLILIFFTKTISAQLTDIARLEYSFIPKNNSEDQYTRLRFLFNYPKEIKKDAFFIAGVEYNRIFLNLNDNYPFDTKPLETLTIIDLNLAYTYKLNKKWRIGLKISPRIASTLNEKITSDDLFLNGGVYFIADRRNAKEVVKPYRLILGLTYNTTAGIPFPLPFVGYFREINNKWTYTLGVPKMNLKHIIDKTQAIQVFASLDGYFAHLQRPTLAQNQRIDNISLSVAVAGLGYEYFLTKHLVWYTYVGYTARLNNVLRNTDREDVFTLDNLNTLYLRSGLKLKI